MSNRRVRRWIRCCLVASRPSRFVLQSSGRCSQGGQPVPQIIGFWISRSLVVRSVVRPWFCADCTKILPCVVITLGKKIAQRNACIENRAQLSIASQSASIRLKRNCQDMEERNKSADSTGEVSRTGSSFEGFPFRSCTFSWLSIQTTRFFAREMSPCILSNDTASVPFTQSTIT